MCGVTRRPRPRAAGLVASGGMDELFHVTCPYCGEQLEIYVEPEMTGRFVQDCEVCCNPWVVHVWDEDDERSVQIGRADGS
jgi:Cysteine-rich CPXCG